MKKKIRVLVVDDSLVFRELVARGMGKDQGIEVVGTAGDAFAARDKIIELEPDVLTLDVEMPKMSGIEFLKRLMPQYPLPVVVVSAVSESVFDALNAGAVDFETKPEGSSAQNIETFITELIIKIKIASMAKVGPVAQTSTEHPILQSAPLKGQPIIAIGASTGGTEAIYEIIRALPADMPGIVIVQHMPPVFTGMYAQRLNRTCSMEVKEAENGDVILPGRVLIAPGALHMRVNKNGSQWVVECFQGAKINGHCPSVDVLFDSVAEKMGEAAIGVILTGMGYDGAKGLLKMKKNGCLTIGQDERSSVVYGMPKVAYDIGAVSKQASLSLIPSLLCAAVSGKH